MAGLGEQKGIKKKKGRKNSQISGEILLKNAIDYIRRGDLINAESAYRKAIKSGHQNHVIFTNLGIICKKSGRFEEAIALYKKAIETNPNEPDATLILATDIKPGNFEGAYDRQPCA